MSDTESDENLSLEEIEAKLSYLAIGPAPAAIVQPTKWFQVEGTVIKINKALLFFDVQTKQHCSRIYVPFYGNIGSLVIFPKIADCVKIKKIKHLKDFYDTEKDGNNKEKTVHRTIAIIDQEAVFKIKSRLIDKCDNQFLLFLNAYKISQEELITINENIVRVVECFIYSGDDLLLLLKSIYAELVCDAPSRKNFRVQVRLPINLKYANPKYDNVYSSLDFHPPSAVNVYHSRTNAKTIMNNYSHEFVSDFLVGTLVVQSTTGQFILKAYSANIVVKFMEFPGSLEEFNNALVIVKKYTVFTEIFTVEGYSPLIYVLVDPQDVVIVKRYFESTFKIQHKFLFKSNETLPMSFTCKYELEITKKSDVVIGYEGSKQVWMEAMVKNHSTQDATVPSRIHISSVKYHKVYVIIPSGLIKLAPVLKQRQTYFFFTNKPLLNALIYNIRELNALRDSAVQFLFYVPSDALFQETEIEPRVSEHIYRDLTVPELRSTMKENSSKIFSFEINISRKEYHTPPETFKSWYPKRHSEMFFGDIDTYQQRLIFYDDETDQYVDLYLSNRENFAFPLGLFMDVKIRVNHVAVNKERYLKTIPLTTFDVLGYHPQNKYSCANLAVANEGEWNFRKTPPSHFGSDFKIPPNTIIHGLIIFRAIYDIRITIICGKCKRINYEADGCIRCQSCELDALASIVFNAADGSNRQHFKMVTDSLEFLLDMLTIKHEQKAMFIRALQRYGPISLNLLGVPLDFKEPKSIVVETMIRKLREEINFNHPIMLDVVAMKQHRVTGYPQKPWLVIDHKFVTQTNE